MLFCLTAGLNFYFVTFLSGDKAQAVHAPNILVAGGGQIDPSGFHAGVSQHIRQLHHIPADLVKRPGKEVKLELSEGNTNGNQWMQCSIRTYTTEKWVIKAVKLELGAQQTLAHQDAEGSWVLNDPPPNKALELAKCQRYQVAFSVPYTVIGSGFAINSTTAHIHLVLANLAGNAAASIKNIYLVSANHPGTNGIIATGIDTLYGKNGNFGSMVLCAGGLTPGEHLLLQLRTNSYFIADKNL